MCSLKEGRQERNAKNISGCGKPPGAMQNSLTGWHPANRIRGSSGGGGEWGGPGWARRGAVINYCSARDRRLVDLAWKGRFGGAGNFPANGGDRLPSWEKQGAAAWIVALVTP